MGPATANESPKLGKARPPQRAHPLRSGGGAGQPTTTNKTSGTPNQRVLMMLFRPSLPLFSLCASLCVCPRGSLWSQQTDYHRPSVVLEGGLEGGSPSGPTPNPTHRSASEPQLWSVCEASCHSCCFCASGCNRLGAHRWKFVALISAEICTKWQTLARAPHRHVQDTYSQGLGWPVGPQALAVSHQQLRIPAAAAGDLSVLQNSRRARRQQRLKQPQPRRLSVHAKVCTGDEGRGGAVC